ncbi:glycosyltransferase family 4 protein [Wenyingzhuangia aestuarii]|uniref:glycosyltransferase family 4 protein n=1 Tax=Wenyingzhuangia aestuarii TaxID=1647582 RepID=UPI00143C61A1|nr:glycosyltransferase family 4 protein [Wenyingzhuangia aestuarii]NJB81746.1 glycosyltransferase involved in cell wall biosynthesis [Wenyingzhuangia aestuarii]
MHIAFLTPEYPHIKTGHSAGIGSSIKNLVQALGKEQHQITVFVYAQKNNEIFNDNGVTIHLIKNEKYTFGKWYFYRKHIQNYINNITASEKIEIIEAPDWTGITAFMSFKIPLVIRLHGSDAYFCYLEKRKQKLKNFWFEKLAIAKANAFIAPTTYAGKVSKDLFKIKNKEIKTIHNGVELNRFEKYPTDQYSNGLILYFGTIIRKKGVLELPAIMAEVVKQYPQAHLVLIGDDARDIKSNSPSTWELMKEQLNSFSTKVKVVYLGKVPYDAVQDYIKKAHVCVFPTYAETLGMVTIESMAMQKAVVNSNIGWSQELIIDGESGFLVHPSDHSEYASKIVKILENNTLKDTIGKAARKRVEQVFDIDKKAVENVTFYKKIIS